MKPVIITRNNRTFEAYVTSIGCAIIEVNIYEVVRPTWKIFRTKFFSWFSAHYFLEDYDTIVDAINECFECGWKREEKDAAIRSKWEEFEKAQGGK